MEWVNENAAILLSAIIGVFGALLGVIFSYKYECKMRKKERIDNAKPIIINYSPKMNDSNSPAACYYFVSDGNDIYEIKGVFKNTNNGLLFFDKIETATKTYYPLHNNAVDRNMIFVIVLANVCYENLKNCTIYCHDIYDNPYYYKAHFCFEDKNQSQIIVDNIMPIKGKKKPK